MRVLGLEGTAWAASAAVYETDPAHESIPAGSAVRNGIARGSERPEQRATSSGDRGPSTDWFASPGERIEIHSAHYAPDDGGIHPREAVEHMREHLPVVLEDALSTARAFQRARDEGSTGPPVDAVAFSRGPGLGPCLRVVGTTARAVAGRLAVPLVGVNHMVAHLEIGRHFGEAVDPIGLNASGANAHLLGYRDGRYRVLGETMDTGVGNAIDKFTRELGWAHPGGPKVEAAARDGEYVDLPYVVKGMDFSFAGLSSAATQAVEDGVPVEDVCRGLEETVFAMLAEVSERALSLTRRDELVLGGGVAQNQRLQEMLATMCADRGARLCVPEDRFLRDNAGMIAVLGAKMAAAGDTLAISESRVDPAFRPDAVPVTWSDPAIAGPADGEGDTGREQSPGGDAATVRGAEAVVTVEGDRVIKRRVPKRYRHPALDERLRAERTRLEARLTSLARRRGVSTPVVIDVDGPAATLTVERVGDRELRSDLRAIHVRTVGRHLATIHAAGFVHGDPTPRNVRIDVAGDRVFLIDFGLGYHTDHVEDFAMDLHVFEASCAGLADDPESLRAALREGYLDRGEPAVLDRLEEIGKRGRYREG